MKRIREALKRRAGVAAFLCAAVVFGVLSIIQPQPKSHQIRVPLVKRFVAQGGRLQTSDIHWEDEANLKPVAPRRLQGYAKVPLFPGEVLSPADLGHEPESMLLVAVEPSQPAEAQVAQVGSYVQIMVAGAHGIVWQTKPVAVVSRSGSTVSVAMPTAEAHQFELMKSKGAVDLVGLSS